MFISKMKLLITVLAMALIVPTTAYAAHTWPDVPDSKFYHDAVEWAEANGMTTGCNGGTAFCPEDNVTRGENITFAKRYDDLVVQPALEEIEDNINNAPRVYFARVDADGTVAKTSHTALAVTNASVGYYIVTLPENADNCTVNTALHWDHSGLFSGLGNIVYNNEALIWSAHDGDGNAKDVNVFVRYADDGATTDSDSLPDPVDLGFSVTAYCSDTAP